MNHNTMKRFKRTAALLLCIILTAALIAPIAVNAEKTHKPVRVGWYDSSFCSMDSNGRRSGYAYEYQAKLAAYSGWDYIYIEGSWPDLLQMLIDGKIDILSDVSYTEERSHKILYPDLSMGTEDYCIFISRKNQEITAADYSTLNGKRVGVNKGSVQATFFRQWAEAHGVTAELIELTCLEDETIAMVNSGSLDAYVTPNAFVDPEHQLATLTKIGSSDFYFAVNKERPDLLNDLNAAMSRINDENPYYNQQMFDKYIKKMGSNSFLNQEEAAWLASHNTIRVGYQDNYLAFCGKNEKTGELDGALKDYLEAASECITDATLTFETFPYPSAAAALEALELGNVDCVFPANLGVFDAEEQGVLLTSSLVRSEVYAVVRQNDKNALIDNEHITVAVNEGNPNYTAFLQENFPNFRTVFYPTTADCLKAVSNGVADCVMISSYRYNNISRLCKNYRLTTYATGVGVDYCFAVAQGDTALYSLLSKVAVLVPSQTLTSALSYYIAEESQLSFMDFIVDNLGYVMLAVGVVLAVILFLFLRSRRSEKMAKRLISATETDDLTGLYNRDYFFQYANRMYRESPDLPRDAIVLNIEQFHSINALNGRAFGDQVLKVLGGEIGTIALDLDGIGGRFGADRFDIYCRHTDDYRAIFERLQNRLDALSSNASVRLRMGVMPWQEKVEPIQLFDRARTACNMARGNYIDHLIIFDEKVLERELFNQRLLNDLKRALDDEEFLVYYQPKFDIRPEKPKLVGAEALIRWQHPEMGMIPPDKFIPLFERNGQISEIDKYVWSHAAHQIAIWKSRYGFTLPVSVNLSRVDVFDAGLMNTLDDILTREGLDHSALELEITESAYTEDAEQLIYLAKTLHRMGYTIEMDDFGTGYSSLNMLSSMPIDVLKMDRAFILRIENNDKDAQMVSLILGIAQNLEIPVIAEGVETESQLLMLKDLGCALVQGYYFSRPLHPDEFEDRFLRH
jgi:diguanylate cyclase (GGDEF)-like protein